MTDNFNRDWVVRVLFSRRDLERNPTLSAFVDALRGAGAVRVPRSHQGQCLVFDVPAPAGVESVKWARTQAERMCALGINAAPAPQWHDCEEQDDTPEVQGGPEQHGQSDPMASA